MSDTAKTTETEVSEEIVKTEAPVEASNETSAKEETSSTEASSEKKAPSQNRKPQRNGRQNRRRKGIREEKKEFQEEMLAIDRVTRVTKGGRQLRFRASVVIGNGKGKVGLGIGKAGEVQGAIEKAIRDAKKNLIVFPISNGTIAHDIKAEYKASSIFLHPAHAGTGIIAGGPARKVFAVAGLKDIIAKRYGGTNRITNARVALKALASLKPAHQVKEFSKK